MEKKLIHIITSKKNSSSLTRKLLAGGFHITVTEATGGFTKQKFIVIVLAIEANQVDQVIKLSKECCKSREEISVNNVPIPTLGQEDLVQAQSTKAVDIKVGGATILVGPLDEIHKV